MDEGKINEDFFDKIGSIRINFFEEFKKTEIADLRQPLTDYSEGIRQENDLQNIKYKSI